MLNDFVFSAGDNYKSTLRIFFSWLAYRSLFQSSTLNSGQIYTAKKFVQYFFKYHRKCEAISKGKNKIFCRCVQGYSLTGRYCEKNYHFVQSGILQRQYQSL